MFEFALLSTQCLTGLNFSDLQHDVLSSVSIIEEVLSEWEKLTTVVIPFMNAILFFMLL